MRLAEIAELLSGKIEGNSSIVISGIGRIETAKEGDITYISHPRYRKYISKTSASCIIVSRDERLDTTKTLLYVDDPRLAIIKLADIFYKEAPPLSGISTTTSISSDAEIDETASIGTFCVLSRNCRIGKRTVLYPQVYVGSDSFIGDDCIIYPGVIIHKNVKIKNRVVIHSGSVIGADGFGYIEKSGERVKIPHHGGIIIEDDVEIGANTTIDRATFGDTIIRKGTKIDNLVHIAHNVVIGENSMIVAQVGISGSTEIGDNVIIAGQAGIGDHLIIGDNVKIGGQSGVSKSIGDGEDVSGYPAREHRRSRKAYTLLMRLPEIYERLKRLEKKVVGI